MTRDQKRIFVVLLCIGTFANMDKGMIGLTINSLQNKSYMYGLGLKPWSASQAGVIASIFYVSFILVTLPGGWIVDRFGYRRFVITSLVILVVGSLCFGLAGFSRAGVILLLVPAARLVTGFGHAGYTNGTPKIIAENFTEQQRGSVQGDVVATAGVGAIVAYTVGAAVIGADWRYAYFLIAGLFAIALVLFLTGVPEQRTPATSTATVPKVGFTEAWKNRNTLVLALALLLNNAVGVGLLTWLPTMFGQHFHVKGVQLTIILIGYAVTMIVSTATANPIIARWFNHREKRFMLMMSLAGAAFLIAAVSMSSPWPSAVLFWASNLCLMWAFAAILLLPYRLIPLRIVGSAFAVINIGAFLGGIAQGILVAAIAATYYYPWAMTALAGCLVLAGVVPYLLDDSAGDRTAPLVAPRPSLDHVAVAGLSTHVLSGEPSRPA